MNSRQHLVIGATAATVVLSGPLQGGWLGLAPWMGLWAIRRPARRRPQALLGLGVAALAAHQVVPNATAAALFAALALWGSIFPDIDHHAAPAGRWGLHQLWRGLTGLAATIGGHPRWGQHRALTHSWVGLVAPTLVWLAMGAGLRHALGAAWWWPAAGWFTGVLSHLVADSTTPSGVRWALPRLATPRPRRQRIARP